jgi:FtsH-binding integral membrane protein
MRRFADTLNWAEDRGFAIHAAVDERLGFLRRTYAFLLMEICLVAVVTSFVLKSPTLMANVAIPMALNPLFYLLAFFGVSFVSRSLVHGQRSKSAQYAGAGVWVIFLGLLMAPFAYLIHAQTGSYAILGQAFLMTAGVFGGLTAYVMVSRKDFSFMGGALSIITAIAFFGSFAFLMFGGGGGIGYNLIWVVILGAWVLYDTSKILHRRAVNEHVAASVDLLVDFVYLLIHIAMILMRSRD